MFCLLLSGSSLGGCWLLILPSLGRFDKDPVRIAASSQGGPWAPVFFLLSFCLDGVFFFFGEAVQGWSPEWKNKTNPLHHRPTSGQDPPGATSKRGLLSRCLAPSPLPWRKSRPSPTKLSLPSAPKARERQTHEFSTMTWQPEYNAPTFHWFASLSFTFPFRIRL